MKIKSVFTLLFAAFLLVSCHSANRQTTVTDVPFGIRAKDHISKAQTKLQKAGFILPFEDGGGFMTWDNPPYIGQFKDLDAAVWIDDEYDGILRAMNIQLTGFETPQTAQNFFQNETAQVTASSFYEEEGSIGEENNLYFSNYYETQYGVAAIELVLTKDDNYLYYAYYFNPKDTANLKKAAKELQMYKNQEG